MQAFLHIIWLLVAFSFSGRTSLAQQSGTIIPLYSYPRTGNGGNAWQRILDAQRSNPIKTWAIVNVNSGPGDAIDNNYATSIPELHSAGISTLGYVSTRYAERSQSEVRAEIDRWKSFYNVNGIFLDEMAYEDNMNSINYYREVNNYAKGQGFTFTVGNPGTTTDPKYFDTVDNIMIFESGTGIPNRDRICGQDTNGKGRESISIIPFNVASLDAAKVEEAKECAGYIYVTDDDLPNPFDTLPSYLAQLFGVLGGGDGGSDESGTIIPLYMYPRASNGDNAWQRIFDAHRAHPIKTWAIVNVNSGPGNAVEPNFATSIPELHSAGINTLGYVSTRYAQRSQSEVRTEIGRWKSFYNVNGIFFDEMTMDDNMAHVNYYRDVDNYAKEQGFTFTVGNPGTIVDPKYFDDTVDAIMVFEGRTGIPGSDRICSQDTRGKGRDSVSIIPYNVAFDEAKVREAKECAGYIYITDDTVPNPWDTLPSYLTRLFEVLRN